MVWVADESVVGLLAMARSHIEPRYKEAVDRLPDRLRNVVGYHAGWWDGDGVTRDGAGKMVRPALLLACAAAVTDGKGAQPTERVCTAALAVELVHDFTLLHDDVMDGDRTRRHQPTVWARFGVNQAILSGDLLLCMAFELLSDFEPAACAVFAEALRQLCMGQWDDLAFERSASVDLASCLRMAEYKTGALMGAACELGALTAGAPVDRARAFGQFGRDVGLAYQLADDLLGIWGDPASTGKSSSSDLARGKKTLPVAAALASDTAAGRQLAELYNTEGFPRNDHDLELAAALIERAGGRRWVQIQLSRIQTSVEQLLQSARPQSQAGADLMALAHAIAWRDR
ncbi:polyprenyl synthetase family protein [Nocardia sp. NPDC004568]|uniref:polyprenyl synthetase family protein n=1 Tax=Nocardia sp. NPDC004568 TaxID=3154551 RepID=UPI0033AC4F97